MLYKSMLCLRVKVLLYILYTILIIIIIGSLLLEQISGFVKQRRNNSLFSATIPLIMKIFNSVKKGLVKTRVSRPFIVYKS